MARGESQNLLICTIVFLILLLIMIIVAVVFYRSWSDAATKFAEAESKNRQLTTEVGTLTQEGSKLRAMIGHPAADMPIADIETAFANHLKLFYAPLLSEEATSYFTALKNISASYANQIRENKKLSDANSQQQAELNAFNEMKDSLRTDFDVEVATIRQEQKTERDNHAKQVAAMLQTNQELEANAKVAIAAAGEKRDEAITARIKADDIREQVMKINWGLTTMVANMDSPIPTYSDADILWVSPDSTRVRVNLGANHGLRPRMPFSVYSADVKEISVNSSKGKIEITRIIDGNTAEARVTEDILMDPILKGDIIYTPVWRPGQRIHVALSSGLDLDGDGIPDPHKAIMLIKQCGGEVDAYIDDLTGALINENGKMVRETFLVGEITGETRYLVTGKTPDPDSSETLFNARRELKETADNHGVITISLNDLLALMGQRPQSQIVGFGPRNRAINNYDMQSDVINHQMPGNVFKKYEDPDAKPDTNNKTPVSPLFNQRPVARPTGTVSPLFQPRTAPTKDVERL
jgi:hypothetical protein